MKLYIIVVTTIFIIPAINFVSMVIASGSAGPHVDVSAYLPLAQA